MLMLTHTWVLREFLGEDYINRHRLSDLYIYNILPDVLPLHETITAEMTHRPVVVPDAITDPPPEFAKSRFIYFHLLTDDFAHFGEGEGRPGSFDPESRGYAYVVGRQVSETLGRIYRDAGCGLSPSETAYRTHVLVEMAFDLALHERDRKLMELLTQAMEFTLAERLGELSRTAGWFYGISEHIIEETMNRASFLGNAERLLSTMNVSGRVGLFLKKFPDGLDGAPKGKLTGELEALFRRLMDLTENKEAFLKDVSGMLHRSGFKTCI